MGDTTTDQFLRTLGMGSVDEIRERLVDHRHPATDPCQDRGVDWPCDVAKALGPTPGYVAACTYNGGLGSFSLPDFIAAALRQRPTMTGAGQLGETVTQYLERSPELVISWLLSASDPDPGEMLQLYEVVSAAPVHGRVSQVLRIALAVASQR